MAGGWLVESSVELPFTDLDLKRYPPTANSLCATGGGMCKSLGELVENQWKSCSLHGSFGARAPVSGQQTLAERKLQLAIGFQEPFREYLPLVLR